MPTARAKAIQALKRLVLEFRIEAVDSFGKLRIALDSPTRVILSEQFDQLRLELR